MTYWVRKEDGVAPTSGSEDVTQTPGCQDNNGPNWMSFAYWIHTPGSVLAGAFTMDLNYLDPTGTLRTITGSPISLQDPAGFFSRPVEMIVRQDQYSQWTIDRTLIGLAGGALISYLVKHNGIQGEVSFWP